MERRNFLRTALGGTLGAALATTAGASWLGAQQKLPEMTVYKSPTCGCCQNWVDHVRANGFTAREINTADLAKVKAELGVPATLQSCHTVVVGGYVVEGHVPAADVKRLLAEKPKVRGIAAPGMPVGSPGMEQGSPTNYDRYDVLTFDAAGKTTVFASHGPPRR